jgi:hypothetical protein
MASTRDEPQQQPLHILFLPYFAPGHLLPVADMAALFAARGARCTILTTPVNADIIRPAVSAGVPMVTWPRYADQFHNEKLVVEVLKVGVSLGAKDYASAMETHVVIPGEVIAGSINRLMGDSLESNSIRNKSKELRVKARIAVEKGGSSYDDIGRLMGELMAGRSAVKH